MEWRVALDSLSTSGKLEMGDICKSGCVFLEKYMGCERGDLKIIVLNLDWLSIHSLMDQRMVSPSVRYMLTSLNPVVNDDNSPFLLFLNYKQTWTWSKSIPLELQVIFPALDRRVKNVARTYSLEHEGESALFDQLFELLNSKTQNEESYRRELALCTGALQTSISQHMSKEEEQVLICFVFVMCSFEFSSNHGMEHSFPSIITLELKLSWN